MAWHPAMKRPTARSRAWFKEATYCSIVLSPVRSVAERPAGELTGRAAPGGTRYCAPHVLRLRLRAARAEPRRAGRPRRAPWRRSSQGSPSGDDRILPEDRNKCKASGGLGIEARSSVGSGPGVTEKSGFGRASEISKQSLPRAPRRRGPATSRGRPGDDETRVGRSGTTGVAARNSDPSATARKRAVIVGRRNWNARPA